MPVKHIQAKKFDGKIYVLMDECRATVDYVLASIRTELAALRAENERLKAPWLCDCHTWPGPDEAHAYIVALEKRLADAERQAGEINDALGILDLCQVVPLVQALQAERNAAHVAGMREAMEIVFELRRPFRIPSLETIDIAVNAIAAAIKEREGKVDTNPQEK